MDTEETFNEKFATIEEALKYITDLQAKSEWLSKQEDVKQRARLEKFEKESERIWLRTKKHLEHITKLTGIAFEELDFQNEKFKEAGKTFTHQR